MEYKSSTPQTKAAGEGKATVVIATLGVKDRDGDVLLKGAFGRQIVSVVPAHDWKSPAIGKASIREEGNEAIADIDFYLSTDAGKNWYHAIKEDFDRPPARQQYSWGFQVPAGYSHHGQHNGEPVRFLHASEAGDPLPIAEVSPVLIGAGQNTRSVSVKETDALLSGTEESERMGQPVVEVTDVVESSGQKLITAHTTPTSDRVWNITIQQQHIKETAGPAYYRNLYAIQDGGSESTKSSYRLLHHFLDERGEPGPASIRACSLYISMLSKGMFPARERDGLYAHWAQHLKDAGMDVPELRSIDNYVYPFNEELKHVIYEWDSVLSQLENIHSIRAKRGMTLTQSQIDQFQSACGRVEAFRVLLALKQLDRPTDEVLQHLSEHARVEAMAQRAEEMHAKNRRQTEDTDRALVEAAVKRAQSKYTFLGGAS